MPPSAGDHAERRRDVEAGSTNDDDDGVLIGPGGNPIVKLFIFAEIDAYDVVFQG